jgi:hypothetical protein
LGSEYIGARFTGEQQFQGLTCLRIAWDSPATPQQAFHTKGFALVCPSRDYKVLYREEETTYQEKTSPVLSEKDVLVVNQLTQYGDVWMPTLVNHEWEKVTADGKRSALSEIFRVVEFEPNALRDDSIFSPIFSPGTRVFRSGVTETGDKLEIAGGDTIALEQQLRTGNFSIFTSPTAPKVQEETKPATPRN